MQTKEERIAYDEGYTAYTEGIALNQNPYTLETDSHMMWGEGWVTAKEDHREHMDSMSPLREEDY